MATYDTAIFSEAADLPGTAGHRYIRTYNDDKSIRLNNRDYEGTGSYNAVQSKPNVITATGGATSFEASPRAAANINCTDLIGFKSNPIVKSGSGYLTGAMRCIEAKLESDSGCTGTIDEAYGIDIMHAMHGTVTHSFPIQCQNAGGGTAWSGQFALVGTDFASTTGDASTNAGKLKVAVGTAASHSDRFIQLYSA